MPSMFDIVLCNFDVPLAWCSIKPWFSLYSNINSLLLTLHIIYKFHSYKWAIYLGLTSIFVHSRILRVDIIYRRVLFGRLIGAWDADNFLLAFTQSHISLPNHMRNVTRDEHWAKNATRERICNNTKSQCSREIKRIKFPTFCHGVHCVKAVISSETLKREADWRIHSVPNVWQLCAETKCF